MASRLPPRALWIPAKVNEPRPRFSHGRVPRLSRDIYPRKGSKEKSRADGASVYFTRLVSRVMRLLYPAKVFARVVELKRVIALYLCSSDWREREREVWSKLPRRDWESRGMQSRFSKQETSESFRTELQRQWFWYSKIVENQLFFVEIFLPKFGSILFQTTRLTDICLTRYQSVYNMYNLHRDMIYAWSVTTIEISLPYYYISL